MRDPPPAAGPIDLLGIDTLAADCGSAPSAPLCSELLTGDAVVAMSTANARADACWPGDTVLATYGRFGRFYRARVVRVYSRSGCSLVDIEWLRPQASALVDSSYVCAAGLDESLHRDGLEMGVEVRRIVEGGMASPMTTGAGPSCLELDLLGPTPAAAPSTVAAAPAAGASASAAATLPSLLDL
eukprot:NODE_2709_length_890_cov_334.182036.p1 GENE.NODE_2709_length_890_cov_334.182036~~NODE_2709_length_890_cov_334.182036.p1  ORF type:complete len:185 (-),score=33.65 NODE_2709_length_890_cov_334.182036:161-715(-)